MLRDYIYRGVSFAVDKKTTWHEATTGKRKKKAGGIG